MVQADVLHDEINLARLLRRLEKSIAIPEDWQESPSQPLLDLWFRSQSGLQKVKFARTLIRNVELQEESTSARVKQLNDAKIQLDRCEQFLTNVAEASKPKPTGRTSFLANLPIPEVDPHSATSPSFPNQSEPSGSRTPSPPLYTPHDDDNADDNGDTSTPTRPTIATKGLLISPPEAEAELSPTLITSLLLPSHAGEDTTASTTSYTKPRSTLPSDSTAGLRHGSAALHDELASQLEVMAAQLKRNALYTSSSLAKDRAVVEGLGEKLEANHDVMSKERTRLRDHSSKSGGTTWLTVGIVLLVLVLFVVMVGFIRFSRI